jgi:cob(I)alamin adenosyltransferase
MTQKPIQTPLKNSKKGFLHIYTGEGKGKTTAALGLALRAMGAGWRVFFAQFLKQGAFSEIKALKHFEGQCTVRQYGTGRFIRGKPTASDIKQAQEGLQEILKTAQTQAYDLYILDEINVAIHFGLLTLNDILLFLEQMPTNVEIVMTGRWAQKELMERADVVTEMKCLAHYYEQGVTAREGIEK